METTLKLFRIVGGNYTYASLADVLEVSASTVRGYLTGYIQPTNARQYMRMRLVVAAHADGIPESLDLRPARCASISEPRADQLHRSCGIRVRRVRNRRRAS